MNIVEKITQKLLEQDKWRIGVINTDIATIVNGEIEPQVVRWLDLSGYDYEADPFVFKLDGKHYIAYEVFDYLHGNGKLECIDLNGQRYDFFNELNRVKGHKSFPFMIEFNGELYCVPETLDLNEISLYKFNRQERCFKKESVILSGAQYNDSCIKEVEGKYYLFTSIASAPFEQLLFCSEQLFGPYFSHPQSPIADSLNVGRNGGGILDNKDEMYRVTQDCEFTYGGKVNLVRIDTISPTEYKESFVKDIKPIVPFPDGLHTLSYCDGIAVIDGKVTLRKGVNVFRKTVFKVMKALNVERLFS
ncbi:glucosamine inositolphosphorylceramide transferase family protein [Photobacterium sanguinicancri]|uniref:glucosamine inositolphosphorylceramide transferase family protein n=1 Tax=Photobacterium sanguinicancri TaxID=875932 RepID=UPI0021C33C85|nr:hypothetical protein [Photobacterium sanguinicancri]